MTAHSKVASRDLGLELGLLFARYLLDSEEMHYGYWTPDMPVTLFNLPAAQRKHTDLILAHLPASAKRVLDVGCGTGGLSLRLVERGCEVECVAPDSSLLDCAEKRLGGRARIHREFFENFTGQGRFDAIVFSESFQYVPVEAALANINRLLNPGGTLLICDFFKRERKKGSPIGGGHKFHTFLDQLAAAGFAVGTDIDITAETAPTITLVNEFMQKVGAPAFALGMDYAQHKWPISTGLAKWWFKKKLAKLNEKYFSGRRTAETFIEFKTYRLLAIQRAAELKPAQAAVATA